jgi:ubiquinone/menaquinone biosynthesis C-methylase UbiE
LDESRREPSNAVETNRAEFTRQAASFAASSLLGAREQIDPVLEEAGIQPGDRLLDVGCGTGFLLLAAAQRCGQAVGVDVTPAMLAEAKRRAEEAGLANVALREANAEALPFADSRFDAVLTRLTLHHMADPGRVLSEMYRVCRAGGRFTICDIIAADDLSRADLHNRMERLRDPSHVRHFAAAELLRLVEEAGFTVTGSRQWQTLRRFGEWTALAAMRSEVRPALAALLEAAMDGDAAGIQAGRAEDGELTFYHHWLVVGGVK